MMSLPIPQNSSEVKESHPSICDDLAGNPDLRALRKKKLKLNIAHLNVTTLRNKSDFLKEQIQDNIDILMISETKIDTSFPVGQLLMNNFSTSFRNAHGGGMLDVGMEDLPIKIFCSNYNLTSMICLLATKIQINLPVLI